MSSAAVLEIAIELGGVSILDKCLSSANLEKEQNHNNKLEESGVHEQDQWERQSHHATTSSSMAIGSLLQRVTKLVSASSPPAGSTTKAGEGEQDHGSSTPVGRGDGGDDSDDAASSPGGSAVRKPSSSSSSNDASMKRSSSELERPETRSDSRNNSKKKLPSPIKTSHLMSSNPRLSVTPATPLTSSPASLSSSSTPAAISKDTGKSRFQAAQRSASSSTSSVQGTSEEKGNNNEKINEQKQEEEGDPDNCRSEAAFLPEEQNRNSSLQSKHDDGIKTSNQLQSQTKRQEHIDEGEIVLEEPQRMTEEDEMKLSQLQERQSTSTSSAHHHNEKIAHSPVKNASCEDDDHTARRGDEEPEENARDKDNAKQKDSHERWTPARQDTGESLFGSSSETPKQEDEDHPNMPRPAASSAAPPPRNFPSKPSLLHRLPSQVISESPGSEYPPTPSSQGGGLSRQSSLGRGDRTGSGFTDITDSATFNFANPHGQAKSDENDRQNNGNQGHLPSMLATAVQDLHQKINKPTDYRFPTQSLADPPPETIAEEGPIQSPESEKENPITASPPSSSSFLDPSSHSNRYSRDSPTSSLQSASSINEYSTPAGFMKHRRSSSQNAPREVKETPNAGYKDLPDGKRKLNNYILTSDIGRGSFGLVQIAKDEETGQEYAAKEFSKMRLKKRQQSEMIRRQAKGSGRRGAVPMRARTMQSDRKSSDQNEPNKSDLDLIRSEVAIMKKLDHPNVVRLYEVLDVQQDDSLFMIVELCRNGPIMNISMGQAVEPMSEDKARNFFRQMILAIEYLHVNGIIHRDIKPENILKMSDDQSIKLVDFGVSEMFSKEDEQRELKTGGSPAFMAPELCMSGHNKISGKATDIWALGATLYCMVVGHLPFESHLMLDLYDKIKTEPVHLPDNLSDDLKDLLLKLLEKDPSKRIRMNELREHPWVTCAGRDPLPSTEMNVTSVEEVTEDDIAQAIAVPSVSYIINAVRAANRWKRFAARRTQSDSAHSDGSVASNEMSRAGSVDAIEALQQHHSRKGSNGSRDGAAPGSTTLSRRVSPEDTSSGKDAGRRPSAGSCSDQSTSDGYMAARTDQFLPSGSHTGARPGASSNKEEDPTTSTLKPSDSSASLTATDATTAATSTTASSSASGIKAAMSFPQSERGAKEKRPSMTTAETASPASPTKMGIKSFDSMVDFPEIDRSISQQEYLSNNGIDDSSVEVLRHYEDTTGHMLPRSAVEEVMQLRKASPRPPSRQTAAGPSPP